MLGAFSDNYFTKMMISRDPVDRFCWEVVKMEVNACSLRSCEREVWENCSRGEWPSSRFGHMLLSLEFCSLTRRFPCFFRFQCQCSLQGRSQLFESKGDRATECLSFRERASPSLHASRAVTRLTVDRAHQVVAKMTRRAFQALRVIPKHGKSCVNWGVKKV